ncbi:MAG: GIY-YIG nuclease family protein [Methanotrichaceae archaeon]|nr:GIY-YIG nuclease family protein [Methanotrichaceae archaeon]
MQAPLSSHIQINTFPEAPFQVTKGIYTLILHLPAPETIAVGALGQIEFQEGYYAYTGSARGPGGFRRIDRHKRVLSGENSTRRWHIDYLLPHTAFVEAVCTPTSRNLECAVAKAIGKRMRALPGFGCSDCRCISHLHHSTEREDAIDSVHLAHASVSDEGPHDCNHRQRHKPEQRERERVAEDCLPKASSGRLLCEPEVGVGQV